MSDEKKFEISTDSTFDRLVYILGLILLSIIILMIVFGSIGGLVSLNSLVFG